MTFPSARSITPSVLVGCGTPRRPRVRSNSVRGAYCKYAMNRPSALNCAAAAVNRAAESAAGISCGRPVYPRVARYSVVPDVPRTTTSPSPTTGESVYAAHLPSAESVAPCIVRHSSYVSCVIAFLPAGNGCDHGRTFVYGFVEGGACAASLVLASGARTNAPSNAGANTQVRRLLSMRIGD